jgi:hypothetical protein
MERGSQPFDFGRLLLDKFAPDFFISRQHRAVSSGRVLLVAYDTPAS